MHLGITQIIQTPQMPQTHQQETGMTLLSAVPAEAEAPPPQQAAVQADTRVLMTRADLASGEM